MKKFNLLIFSLFLLLPSCMPISFFSLASGVSGYSGYSELAERVTDTERSIIINKTIERLEESKSRKVLSINHQE